MVDVLLSISATKYSSWNSCVTLTALASFLPCLSCWVPSSVLPALCRDRTQSLLLLQVSDRMLISCPEKAKKMVWVDEQVIESEISNKKWFKSPFCKSAVAKKKVLAGADDVLCWKWCLGHCYALMLMMTDVQTRKWREYEAAFLCPPAKPLNLSSWKRPCAVVVTHRGCYLFSEKASEVEYLSEAGQLLWEAQKWAQKEKQVSQKRHRWISCYRSHRWLNLHTGSNPEVYVEYPGYQKIRASTRAVLLAFQPSWMSMVPGGWHGWRVYFSACICSRANGPFCTERAKDSCPMWTHTVPLLFPWHFAALDPSNCSVLVLNSKWFQLRHSGMTRPVTKLDSVLT